MTAHGTTPPDPIAPWAEIVPGAPYPLTVDDMYAIPDDRWCYELVQGVLVRLPFSSPGASSIAAHLGARLGLYVEDKGLGALTGAQGGYRLDPAHPDETELLL